MPLPKTLQSEDHMEMKKLSIITAKSQDKKPESNSVTLEIKDLQAPEVFPVNHGYLVAFVSGLMLCSTIQVGWGFTESGQPNYVFAEQLGWEADGTAASYSTYVTIIHFAGVAVGANLAPKLI